MDVTTLRLPLTEFLSLAGGESSPEAIEVLRNSQLSKNMLMLRAIIDDVREKHPLSFAAARVEANYDLLASVQQADSGAVAAVLLHPQVGSWLGHCLSRVHSTTDEAMPPLRNMLAQLGAVAAAAAIHAGYECEVTIPLEHGTVMLPTLGAARLAQETPQETVIVRCRHDEVTICGSTGKVTLPTDPRRDADGWSGLRRLRAGIDGQDLTVDLDDLSPFRDFGKRPSDRLPDEVAAHWQELLEDAWTLLVRRHPHQATMTAAMLTSIGTLDDTETGSNVNLTSRDAFGAVYMSPPADAEALAEALVHELSHSKLNALMELVPLCAAQPGELFYSPWKDDPRPLTGVLHGAYSFLAVADFWRRQRDLVGGQETHFAVFRFARMRAEVSGALETLLNSGRLSEHGIRFVAAMAAWLASWEDPPMPQEPAELADQEITDHGLRWRLGNARPDHRRIEDNVTAWLRDEPSPLPFDAVAAEVLPGERKQDRGQRGRSRLTHIRLEDPRRFSRIVRGTAPLPSEATDADLAFVAGDDAEAVRRYCRQITAHPERTEQWAGLGMACRRLADDSVGRMLTTRPEVASAVYLRIVAVSRTRPGPLDVAGWLALPAAPPRRPTSRDDVDPPAGHRSAP